jgi:hypothetical protein
VPTGMPESSQASKVKNIDLFSASLIAGLNKAKISSSK